MSATERIALESGTIGMERFLFRGRLGRDHLSAYVPRRHPTENDAKIHSRLPQLLEHVDEYATIRRRQTRPDDPFWDAARANGFFGLIVPDEYGGCKLSTTGLSTLLQKLASVSAAAPVHVMVPASLGPAELLTMYGTEAQKQAYLPRLARGAIPCFALTSLEAGSDAAGSMSDVARVYRRDDGSLGLRLACSKRYITLAPVADIVGVAFRVDDSEGLFEADHGRRVHDEITLALVDRDAEHLRIGERTDPLGVGFANGTVIADGVEIDVATNVIGGSEGVGSGWKFLMEALAAGRGIALPAGAAGSSKMLTNAVSAYACVRKQFKTPIAKFEGVREKVSEMVLATYEIDALVALMNAVLENKERPPILSAILKYRCTELGRHVVGHAMDVMAGAAICMGPRNFVAPAYMSAPIGITVEGSNTMTRSLLIFGQGMVRSHPHVLALLRSIEGDDEAGFRSSVGQMVRDGLMLLAPSPALDQCDRYARFFALSANASLALGGNLKKREYLSGRYADMMCALIGIRAVEWHADHNPQTAQVAAAVRTRLLHRLAVTTEDIVSNHPHGALHRAILRKTIGWRTLPKDVSDATRDALCAEMERGDSAVRALFEASTLPECHPNVDRLRKAMIRGVADLDDSEVRAILEVDIFSDGDQENGR